jgi:peptide/nickel transport system permease protein
MSQSTTLPGAGVARIEKRRASQSLTQSAIRYVLHDRLTMFALSVIVLLTLTCLLAPPVVESVLKVDPNRTSVLDRYLAPGVEGHLLGTDQLGRDQLIRLLYGGRISLLVAYSASLMSICIGVTLGIMAGYYGGMVDDGISWFINTLSSIPSIFLLILASTALSPSPTTLIIMLALLGWMWTCRLTRGEVLSLKERDYVLAARALGASTPRIMFAHILPNLFSQLIVALTIDAGTLILVESGLSFLGLGIQQPTPSWGNMLSAARSYFATGLHLVIWPGILITVTVLCFYVVGDGLRDAFDPRTSRK